MSYYPITPVYIDVLEVLEDLKACAPWDKYPVLAEADALAALYKSRLVDVLGRPPDQYVIWRPATAYAEGAVVVPTTLNGHYYTVTTPSGTSGAVEPVWPLVAGATVVDNDLTWQESGQALWYGAFDVNYAAALLWRQKAGLTAHMVGQSVDGQTFNPQDLHKQFMDMYRYYKRLRGVQSVPFATAMGHLRGAYRSNNAFDWWAI